MFFRFDRRAAGYRVEGPVTPVDEVQECAEKRRETPGLAVEEGVSHPFKDVGEDAAGIVHQIPAVPPEESPQVDPEAR